MELRYTFAELRLRQTFRTAHGASDLRRTMLIRLDEGWGEAAPLPYHGESLEGVAAFLETHRGLLSECDDPAAIVWLMRQLPGSHAARAAVDMALHDLLGRRTGLPVRLLLGLGKLDHPQTSFTLPLAEPETLRLLARQAAHYPILKLKLGGEADLEALRIVREQAPHARLRVDANSGWSLAQALRMLPALAELGVELLEQPLPRDDLQGLAQLHALSSLPIFVDESVRLARDIPPLAGLVDGVNIKLQKTGGLVEAQAAIATARAYGLQVMLGCMIESSLGVAAALALAPLADYIDLDAPLLIANDPFQGLTFEGASLLPSLAPGLGVEPRVELPGMRFV